MNTASGISDHYEDAAGTRHTPVDAGARARIVCLVPSITELLFELGLGEQVVGRTHYCIHPEAELRGVPSLGGTKKINLSRLTEVAPTHVIVNVDENTKEMVEQISPVVPHVIVTHPIDPRDNLHLYRLLGGIFGRGTEAEDLCSRFNAAYDAATTDAQNWGTKRVLYLIWKDPWMTVSVDTYISRMLATVGWQTVAHDPETRYPAVDLTGEFLADVDLVLFSSEPFAFSEVHVDEFNAAHPDGPHALLVDGEMTSWYGSRAIEGLAYLARLAGNSTPK